MSDVVTGTPLVLPLYIDNYYTNEWDSTPHRRNACLHHYSIRSQTLDLENLFSNVHSRDECLWQVSLKSLHQVQRYCITRNRCQRTDGRTDGLKTHNASAAWRQEIPTKNRLTNERLLRRRFWSCRCLSQDSRAPSTWPAVYSCGCHCCNSRARRCHATGRSQPLWRASHCPAYRNVTYTLCTMSSSK